MVDLHVMLHNILVSDKYLHLNLMNLFHTHTHMCLYSFLIDELVPHINGLALVDKMYFLFG